MTAYLIVVMGKRDSGASLRASHKQTLTKRGTTLPEAALMPNRGIGHDFGEICYARPNDVGWRRAGSGLTQAATLDMPSRSVHGGCLGSNHEKTGQQ